MSNAFLPKLEAVRRNPLFYALDLETTVTTRTSAEGTTTYDPMPYNSHAFAFAGMLGTNDVRVESWYERDRYNAGMALDKFLLMLNRLSPVSVICGHNLKFDLQHLPGVPEPLVWDTMVAEYILSGQERRMASLDDLAAHYGLPAKMDVIGHNLKAGITPDKIPSNALMDYLRQDVALAYNIARLQYGRATATGQVELILAQGEALKAYAMVEKNGMGLDTHEAVLRRDELVVKEAELVRELGQTIRKITQTSDLVPDAELLKPRALSAFFFSVPSTINLSVPIPPGYGGPLRARQKNLRAVIQGTGFRAIPPSKLGLTDEDLKTAHGWFKTDEDVLGLIAKRFATSEFAKVAEKVLQLREVEKLVHTYYQPLLEYAAEYKDNYIHAKINQTVATTGRTSSSQPNAQNIPSSVRSVLVPEGCLEIDFRQLEMCALAHLSGDPALIKAILAGDDIHYMTGQLVYGYKSKSDETPEKRRIIKTINFGLAYGGGARTLAEQAGVSVDIAAQAIGAFYKKFPATKTYNDQYFDLVVLHPGAAGVEPCETGTKRVHKMESETGRIYTYHEQRTPDWLKQKTGLDWSFSPTQTKNYPVQGFATGDIVPLALALLPPNWRSRLVGVVHDSFVFRCMGAIKDELAELEYAVTEDTQHALDQIWGIKLAVPLRIEIKMGPNWGSLTTVR
jgi:DNA polymerase I-like protein with 3'-5' exonuclease and polymerase domains